MKNTAKLKLLNSQDKRKSISLLLVNNVKKKRRVSESVNL
jgi:hypothetical protein